MFLPELCHRPNETASKHPWRTFSHVQIGRNVNTAKAQASEQSTDNQYCIGVGYALDDNTNTHEQDRDAECP